MRVVYACQTSRGDDGGSAESGQSIRPKVRGEDDPGQGGAGSAQLPEPTP